MRLRTRYSIPALLTTLALALAGCGNEISDANDAIDRTQDRARDAQEQVDRATDAIEDPGAAAKREADRALEDAISPDQQP